MLSRKPLGDEADTKRGGTMSASFQVRAGAPLLPPFSLIFPDFSRFARDLLAVLPGLLASRR